MPEFESAADRGKRIEAEIARLKNLAAGTSTNDSPTLTPERIDPMIKTTQADRELIQKRFTEGRSVKEIFKEIGPSRVTIANIYSMRTYFKRNGHSKAVGGGKHKRVKKDSGIAAKVSGTPHANESFHSSLLAEQLSLKKLLGAVENLLSVYEQ